MLILSKSLSIPPERDGMLGLVLSPRDFHPNVARSCGPNILPGMRPKTAQFPMFVVDLTDLTFLVLFLVKTTEVS